MKQQTIRQLNNINRRFYEQVAIRFDQTRQLPWQGWLTLLELIRAYQKSHQLPSKLSVIDVGSGNGRFYSFLRRNSIMMNRYTGIDNNPTLLHKLPIDEAQTIRLIESDIVEDVLSCTLDFPSSDVIALFGIMHHIPSHQLRLEFVNQLQKKLNPGGILVISFWQYHIDPRFVKKIIPWTNFPEIELVDLETNDHLISWDDKGVTPRYVHSFKDCEIDTIISKTPLKLISRYSADGKNNHLNSYVVLEKH